MTHAPEILLEHHLKKLKLPTVLREYQKVAVNAELKIPKSAEVKFPTFTGR